jgi:hypothetical protein
VENNRLLVVEWICASRWGNISFQALQPRKLSSSFQFLLDWRTFNDPSLAAKLGISAGKNHLGKNCFIGRGILNRQLTPGRLMIEPTQSSAAGLYVEFALKEHLLTSNVEFYAKEANCNYKWIPSSNGQDVTNAIQFKNDSYTFYIGRAFLQGSTQVGKVVLEHRVM